MDKVLSKIEGNVATINFNHEKALNSFDNSMLDNIYCYLDKFNNNNEVRIIIIEGSENFFSAGDNLKGMATQGNPDPSNLFDKYIEGYPKITNKIREVNKPVIGKVKKFAYGAAFEILLACDFVYATEDSMFGLPFVKRGISSGTSLLLDYVDYKKAIDILFTGRDIDVYEAKNLGFISDYGKAEEIDQKIIDLVQKLNNLPTETIGLIKRSLNNNLNKPLKDRFVDQCLHTNLSAHTMDFKEGYTSFEEKREPIFNRGVSNENKSE